MPLSSPQSLPAAYSIVQCLRCMLQSIQRCPTFLKCSEHYGQLAALGSAAEKTPSVRWAGMQERRELDDPGLDEFPGPAQPRLPRQLQPSPSEQPTIQRQSPQQQVGTVCLLSVSAFPQHASVRSG